MTMDNELRAVYWDLGGVLLRTEDVSYRERWGKRFGMGPWELERLVFRTNASKLASLGKASVDDIWKEVQQQLDIPDDQLAELQADFFAGDQLDQTLVSFIRSLKQNRITIGLISNAWPDTRDWLENHVKIADLFDHMVISSEIGMAKPDPRIYELALNGLQIKPAQAVFVDDFIENIEGAEALGMVGLHFQDPQMVMRILRKKFSLPA